MNKEIFNEKINLVYNKLYELGYEKERILGIFLYGSQNYGLDTPKSDYDFKVIVFPKMSDLLFKRQVSKTYKLISESDDDQIEVKDLQTMMEMWRKGNPAYIEILETPHFHTNYPSAIEELKSLNPATVNNLASVSAFYGMALQKLKAIDHPYPSKVDLIEKYGYDSKQLSHIVRLHDALTQAYAEYSDNNNKDFNFNDYVFNLTDEKKNEILTIKGYSLSKEEAIEMAEKLTAEMKEMKDAMIDSKRREIGALEFNTNVWNQMTEWMEQQLIINFRKQIMKGMEK